MPSRAITRYSVEAGPSPAEAAPPAPVHDRPGAGTTRTTQGRRAIPRRSSRVTARHRSSQEHERRRPGVGLPDDGVEVGDRFQRGSPARRSSSRSIVLSSGVGPRAAQRPARRRRRVGRCPRRPPGGGRDEVRVTDGLRSFAHDIDAKPGLLECGRVRVGDVGLGDHPWLVALGRHAPHQPAGRGDRLAGRGARSRERISVIALIWGWAEPPIVPATAPACPSRWTSTGIRVCAGRFAGRAARSGGRARA